MKEKLLKPQKSNKFDSQDCSTLFFAVGFAALLTLGILGYLKLSGIENKTVEITSIPNKRQLIMQEKIQIKLPALKNKMLIPLADELVGKWFTTFGASSIAELTMVNNNFELIYTSDSQGRIRKYSRGNYKYDEQSGKITLYPSKEAGKPKEIKGVGYKILTMRHYDIFISKKSDDYNLYFLAPEYEIASKNFHPLFLYADYEGAPVLKFSPVKIK